MPVNNHKQHENNDLISVEELCGILGIQKGFCYSLLKEPELNAFKIGKRRYVTREDFDNYIKCKKTSKKENDNAKIKL